MKILFYIESLRSGGKERRLVELIKGLKKYPDIEMELVLTREDIHYTDIFNTGVKIHYTIRKGLKKDPRLFWKFCRLARKFKPDIIHVWGNMVAIYAIPAKVLLRTPMINNQITEVPLKFPKGILNHKLTFRFSDLIISNSYEGLKVFKTPVEKSVCIHNGFNFSRIEELESQRNVKKRYNISTKFTVGMFAKFSPYKDYYSFFEAAKKVISQCDNVTFIAVGGGDSADYEKSIPEGLRKKIIFLGEQKNVEAIMNICDIGVLASFTEGISNSIIELMALSKPVIATGVGGTKEIIENNNNGFLLSAKAPLKLAETIINLLKDDNLREVISVNAKNTIVDKFEISTMVKFYNQEYRKLCVE